MTTDAVAPKSHEITDSLLEMAQDVERNKAGLFGLAAASFLRESADRIQRQHDEIERLRAALQTIAYGYIDSAGNSRVRFDSCRIARDALGK